MSAKGSRGSWLPFEIYKSVRPYIEKLVAEAGRPMSYEEVHSKLFDAIGPKKALSHAQIGSHICRSKKLARFNIKTVPYVVSMEAFDKFMAGRI